MLNQCWYFESRSNYWNTEYFGLDQGDDVRAQPVEGHPAGKVHHQGEEKEGQDGHRNLHLWCHHIEFGSFCTGFELKRVK